MADLLILSDYPAINDTEKKFMDAHGRYLWHLLYLNHIDTENLEIHFIQNSVREMRSGGKNPKGEALRIIKKVKPKVVLALGQYVTKALSIEGGIGNIRGSVFEERNGKQEYLVIPTYNPRDLKDPARIFADEPLAKGFYTAGDISKAKDILENGFKRPKENFLLDPTIEDVRNYCKEALDNDYLLGLDIEATSLDTDVAEIVCIGLAHNEEDCIVIPFTKEQGLPYWHLKEEQEVKSLLGELFRKNRIMCQNGVGYDVPLLRKRHYKFPIENFTDDTMVLHHVLSPELPHNIGFISSQYGKQPYWKAVMSDFWGTKIFTADQHEMKLYNARDCVALHQIRNGMLRHLLSLEERDETVYGSLREVYQKNMRACHAVIEMTEHGVAISKARLDQWHDFVDENFQRLTEELSVLHPLPDSFNLSSPYHKRLLIYGEIPPKIKGGKYLEELEKYELPHFNYQYACPECDRRITKKFAEGRQEEHIKKMCPGCKVERDFVRSDKEPTSVKGPSKETKKYQELDALRQVASITPLVKLKGYKPLTTESGKSALDGSAIVRYLASIYKRLDEIKGLIRRSKRHDKEEQDLKHTAEVLQVLQKLSKMTKLKQSFWDFPIGADGRVHPSFLVTGTATGRWSSKNPNAQQYPSGRVGKKIRSVFRSSKGCKLLSVD